MAEIEAAVVQPMADVEELLSLVGNMTALTTLEDEARAGFKGCLPQIPRDFAASGPVSIEDSSLSTDRGQTVLIHVQSDN